MTTMVHHTASPAQTKALAKKFAKKLKKGDVVSLVGDLGSGKTTFVQGLASGLGVKGKVKSPSYVLVNEYGSGPVKLYHMDLYRLGGGDFVSNGLDEYLSNEGICVIEWADRLTEDKLKASYRVMVFWESENNRKIEIEVLNK